MIISKNISSYVMLQTTSLQHALATISSNKHRICYLVDEKNHLVGSLSDGDVRRWLLSSKDLDLLTDVKEISNSPCFSMNVEDPQAKIEMAFNERILSIPLIDSSGHLVAIAEPGKSYVDIGGRKISNDDNTFVIAEIGNNHQGDIEHAKELVDLAVTAGVDCVKFQMRNLRKLYRNDGDAKDASADLGAQYTLDLLAKFQLSDSQLFEVFDYCKLKGTIPLCTPWDLDSLKKLEDYGMLAYKVASADFTNYEILDALSKTGKPLLCSTGMSSEDEIRASVEFLKKRNSQFILLHCNSTYPTPYKDVNLKYISNLAKVSQRLVGYSGHERGWSVPVAAVALGAKVIEKHLTTDRGLEGNDHKVSLLPDEFRNMVIQIREVEEALGTEEPREISQGELINREVLAKSLILNRDLREGDLITRDVIEVKSPGQGLQPNRIEELVGKRLMRAMKAGDFFYESDINGDFVKNRRYTFTRPYGIPVRYHDFKALTEGVELDFVEFHLSYRDLDVDLDAFIAPNAEIGFAVHAPELFEGDHILDLCSEDALYRERSIDELDRVIQHTRQLKRYFKKTKSPIIVLNAGGWNSNGFLPSELKLKKYEFIKDALNRLDLNGVQLAIQTMPPFPWHFGGQSYHNLFLDPYEIVDFCENTGHKICLDVSHSMMACNHFGWNLYEFVQTVGPYIVHMHIVDAKGTDGEGIQIGKGDADFKKLGRMLDQVCPNVQFIPEIWQGHKNRGYGFWSALAYLEKAFADQ